MPVLWFALGALVTLTVVTVRRIVRTLRPQVHRWVHIVHCVADVKADAIECRLTVGPRVGGPQRTYRNEALWIPRDRVELLQTELRLQLRVLTER